MKINYWNCVHNNYEEFWDGEDEGRMYGCLHPDGVGTCDLGNKYCDIKIDCPLFSRRHYEVQK